MPWPLFDLTVSVCFFAPCAFLGLWRPDPLFGEQRLWFSGPLNCGEYFDVAIQCGLCLFSFKTFLQLLLLPYLFFPLQFLLRAQFLLQAQSLLLLQFFLPLNLFPEFLEGGKELCVGDFTFDQCANLVSQILKLINGHDLFPCTRWVVTHLYLKRERDKQLFFQFRFIWSAYSIQIRAWDDTEYIDLLIAMLRILFSSFFWHRALVLPTWNNRAVLITCNCEPLYKTYQHNLLLYTHTKSNMLHFIWLLVSNTLSWPSSNIIFPPFRFDTHILPTWHDKYTSIFCDTQQCVFQFFHSYHLRLSLSIYPIRVRAPRRCRCHCQRGRRCLGFCSTLDRWLRKKRSRRMSIIQKRRRCRLRPNIQITISIDILRRVNDTRLSAQWVDSRRRRRGISNIRRRWVRTEGRGIMREESKSKLVFSNPVGMDKCQLQRLMLRDNSNEKNASARLSWQLPHHKKTIRRHCYRQFRDEITARQPGCSICWKDE